MINKTKGFKKAGIALLTTAIVGSQVVTTIPYNVFASETEVGTKPVISTSDKTLTRGDSFDPKAGVTASDEEPIKNSVTVNTIDDDDLVITGTATPGIPLYIYDYTTNTYIVYDDGTLMADADGNYTFHLTKPLSGGDLITVGIRGVSNAQAQTTVISSDTTKPVINASDKTLTVGDSFDPEAGVTASDNEDGNITSKIQVTSNNVDTSKAGTYSVVYSVTDAAGNMGTKTITVTVKTNVQVTINPLTDKDTVITGTGTPGQKVQFYDWTSFQFIPDVDTYVIIDSSGHYSYNLSNRLVAGHEIAAILVESENFQARTTVIHVADTTKPVITASDKSIRVGDSFDPKSGVTASDNEDGNITSKIEVTFNNVDTSKAGTYSVVYRVEDAAGNWVSKTITVTVKSNDKPVINGVITTKTIDQGSNFNPRTGVAATDTEDGDLTSAITVTGSVNTNVPGVYSITYTVIDSDGNTTTKTSVITVKAVATGEVTVNTFTIGKDGYITGAYSGDVAKLSVMINGKKLNTVTATGTPFKYYVGNQIESVSDAVEVIAYDANGNELDRATVALKNEPATTGTITANDFTIGQDGYVEGAFTGDVAKVSMMVNGKEATRIQVAGGSYKYYAGGKILSVNDSVTMIAYDTKGKELDRANVLLKNKEIVTEGTITADTFQVGGADAYIHGTTTGDVVQVKMFVNGNAVSQKSVNEDGSYDYYARSSITSISDDVVMVAYDAKGRELDRQMVTLN